jgi:hypothetical protein
MGFSSAMSGTEFCNLRNQVNFLHCRCPYRSVIASRMLYYSGGIIAQRHYGYIPQTAPVLEGTFSTGIQSVILPSVQTYFLNVNRRILRLYLMACLRRSKRYVTLRRFRAS